MSNADKDKIDKITEPSDDPGLPEAKLDDPQPARAPGGADSNINESDVGSGEHGGGGLLTADQPRSAQQDEVDVPDALQEGEDTGEPTTDGASDPETSKAD